MDEYIFPEIQSKGYENFKLKDCRKLCPRSVFIFCSEKNLKFFGLKIFRRPSGGIFINYYDYKEYVIVVWLPQAKKLLYFESL